MSSIRIGRRMADADREAIVAAVRRFNRFHTPPIGLLQDGYLDSPFSLTEVRVLYELAQRDGVTPTQLARTLSVDPAYVSRILRGFSEVGLIDRRRSHADGRQSLLSLTRHGRAVFRRLDR